MRARIDTSGTHVKDGFLKVRIDLYPGPVDKTYLRHDVEHFDAEGRSLGYSLNPCLCHLIEVPEDITREQLRACAEQLFTPDCLATLDEALVQPDAAHRISPYMKRQPKMAAAPVQTADTAALVDDVNTRLDGLEINGDRGEPENIAPQSIDVGAEAINRAGNSGTTSNWGVVNKTNPANADGTLDTVQVYAYTNINNGQVGTVTASGNSLTTRDYENLGTIASGSTQTFTGLSIDVLTNDYIGLSSTSGKLDAASSGGSGVWYLESASALMPYSGVTFSSYAGWIESLYGTGTESGGATEKTSAETGTGVDGVSGRGLAGGETGAGAESQGPRSFYMPDAGSGAELALVGVALLAGDSGLGAEYAHILGLWEVLFSSDDGLGSDALKALTARTGPDTRLRPGYGRVNLPHKEVNR